MSERITELYSDADMEQIERRAKRGRTALWTLAAAALAVCVALAACTNTMNAPRMEAAAIAVSTLAGWVVIYGAVFTVIPARRELAHARMLRTEQRQRAEGTVTVTDERFTIRKSVPVRRVEVRRGDEVQRFLVCASRAGALVTAKPAALYASHGYVAAYEVDR